MAAQPFVPIPDKYYTVRLRGAKGRSNKRPALYMFTEQDPNGLPVYQFLGTTATEPKPRDAHHYWAIAPKLRFPPANADPVITDPLWTRKPSWQKVHGYQPAVSVPKPILESLIPGERDRILTG